MHERSGPFPRESGLPSGFAGRRMERRTVPSEAAPRAWRSPGGQVLRLPPERLATLASEVRAAAHPAGPAAADPETAVREHVGALARAARPAGTVTDRVSGRPLHVFRAPGRAGEMEIITAAPRGALFDIVEVRPAGMQGELEVYQNRFRDPNTNQDLSRVGGVRVRGPHATITWDRIGIPNLRNQLALQNVLNCVYILTWEPNALPNPLPRYVGIAADLRKRWAPRLEVLELFQVNAQDFYLWVGGVQAQQNQVHRTNNLADPDQLVRADIEHVLIRRINNDLQANGAPLLANEQSVAPVLSDPHLQNFQAGGGIDITNQLAQGANVQQLPWFLPPQIQINPNVQFEIPADAGALAGSI